GVTAKPLPQHSAFRVALPAVIWSMTHTKAFPPRKPLDAYDRVNIVNIPISQRKRVPKIPINTNPSIAQRALSGTDHARLELRCESRVAQSTSHILHQPI